MRDPFRPNTNKQLIREAQVGFTVIGLLIAVLIYVAYYRIHGLSDNALENPGNTSVAMQTNFDSPSFESQNTPTFSASSGFQNPRNQLTEVPKQMLEKSDAALRKIGTAAKSIESTASKVQSLASVPVQINTVGNIGNPAAERSTFNPERIARASTFEPLAPSTFKKRLPVSTPKNSMTRLPETNQPSNGFKPIEPKPIESKPIPSKPEKIETGDFSGISVPRLPKKLRNSFSDTVALDTPIRAPQTSNKTDLDRVEKTEPTQADVAIQPNVVTKEPDPPVIQTVAFQKTSWVVKKGDSYWSIAKSHYGDGRFFRALFQVNRKTVPGFENLVEGVELNLPTIEELVKSHSQFCPADVVFKDSSISSNINELAKECDAKLEQCFYETKTGDTLFGIATQQLGQASRYVELLELNRFRIAENVTQETQLPTGIRLLLPKK